MTQKEKQTAIPKLRFSEFRNAPAWISKELRSIADPISERAKENDANHILTLSAEHGLVLQSEYFGKQVAGTNAERYFKIRRNDFVYNDRTTKASEYGTIKRLTKYPHGIVSPIYKCFRFRNEESSSFWEFYFESAAHEWQLRKLANEGARAGRFNVTIERFLSTRVFSPETSSGEQKKVAECLSTLDELIEAESRKLDALKDHKKGLMQQLFPREGETRPRLRFPEFRNAPEWTARRLGDACSLQAGMFVRASEIKEQYEVGLYPCYGGNGLRGYTATFTHDGAFPLVGRQGALCGNVKFCTGKFHATEHALVATPKTGIDVKWLYYALDFLNLNRFATGQAQPGLSVDVLEKVHFSAPDNVDEQQRIADCLSSLHDLIATQSDKLETLRNHKRGLMQQLFPNPSEF